MANALGGGTSVIASGTIGVSRFVRIDPANDFSVIQCSAGTDPVFGISQDGSNMAPGLAYIYSGSDPTPVVAATAGLELMIYTPGDECNLIIGSGGCTRDNYLKPDSGGAGVAASGGTVYGAKALQSANQGELCRVIVQIGYAS